MAAAARASRVWAPLSPPCHRRRGLALLLLLHPRLLLAPGAGLLLLSLLVFSQPAAVPGVPRASTVAKPGGSRRRQAGLGAPPPAVPLPQASACCGTLPQRAEGLPRACCDGLLRRSGAGATGWVCGPFQTCTTVAGVGWHAPMLPEARVLGARFQSAGTTQERSNRAPVSLQAPTLAHMRPSLRLRHQHARAGPCCPPTPQTSGGSAPLAQLLSQAQPVHTSAFCGVCAGSQLAGMRAIRGRSNHPVYKREPKGHPQKSCTSNWGGAAVAEELFWCGRVARPSGYCWRGSASCASVVTSSGASAGCCMSCASLQRGSLSVAGVRRGQSD